MDDLIGIIIPTHNNAPVIERTLQSVDNAIAHFRRHGSEFVKVHFEVVVVNDNSTDGAGAVVDSYIRGRPSFHQIHASGRSAGSSRNTGVRSTNASVLCFLDGDDVYLPNHLLACYRALREHRCGYIRTFLRVAGPIHPDWHEAMANSSMVCLCIRRECHDFLEGVPDYHLFRREGDEFEPMLNLCSRNEDIYYNELLVSFFHGYRLPIETVEYFRYPGNSLDKQFEKFCRPWGEIQDVDTPDEHLRKSIIQHVLRWQKHKLLEKRHALGDSTMLPFKV